MTRRSRHIATAALGLSLVVGNADAQMSQFKGMTTTSQSLSARIGQSETPLELDWYLPAHGLDYLLGTWSTFGSEHSFQNGTPNALSMVIWHVTLSGFARSMGASCQAPQMPLHPRFVAELKKLCAWPAPEAKADAVMTAFWLGMMGYEAPRAEYLAWRQFFLTSSYKDRPASEAVSAMTLAILMNPYFLLQR